MLKSLKVGRNYIGIDVSNTEAWVHLDRNKFHAKYVDNVPRWNDEPFILEKEFIAYKEAVKEKYEEEKAKLLKKLKEIDDAIDELDKEIQRVEKELAKEIDDVNKSLTAKIDTLESKTDNHIADNIRHITAAERTAWNAKYDKPVDGIPKTDLEAWVQNRLLESKAAYVFNNKAHLDSWLTTEGPAPVGNTAFKPSDLRIGDDLYILDEDESDYWYIGGGLYSDLRTTKIDLSGYSVVGHGHAISDVSGLQTALDDKWSKTESYSFNSFINAGSGTDVDTPSYSMAGTFESVIKVMFQRIWNRIFALNNAKGPATVTLTAGTGTATDTNGITNAGIQNMFQIIWNRLAALRTGKADTTHGHTNMLTGQYFTTRAAALTASNLSANNGQYMFFPA